MLVNEEKERKNYKQKNVYEDFKESFANIASKRRVSTDKLLSKTFSQNVAMTKPSPETSSSLSIFYRKIMSSAKTEQLKQQKIEKNNKNLKNLHQNFNLKIDIEANNNEKERNIKHLSSMRNREKPQNDLNSYQGGYIKTEPCYISSKVSNNEDDTMTYNNKMTNKPKKKSRVNKVLSLQPTINNHVKSKLDHKNGSTIGTTEEEFESDEISEGTIENDENNRIEKKEISEGIVYGIGGIPIKNTRKQQECVFSFVEKENKNSVNNESGNVIFIETFKINTLILR